MKKLVIAAAIAATAILSINCGKMSSSPNPGMTCTPSAFGHLDASVTSPSLGSGILYASKYHLTAASKLIGFSFNPLAATGSILFAIYTDTGGSPGNLIAQTAFTAAAAPGPQTVYVAPQVNISAGNYWLACLTDSSSLIGMDSTGSSGGSRYIVSPSNGYSVLPATFSINGTVTTDTNYYIMMNANVACQ